MEVFSAFGLIVLVGLAIPIALVLGALLFDLAVVVYLAITPKVSRNRKPHGFELVPRAPRKDEGDLKPAWQH
jgi:hypothetical protein